MRSLYPRSRSSPWNWSTRLRRWVRISTPPVREASTKPSAATVLPAPVACSNQKRLAALGSSGASATSSSTSRAKRSSQSCGSSGSSSSSSSSSPGRPGGARWTSPSSEEPLPLPLRSASASSAVSVPDSASTWWAESTVPSTSVGASRGSGEHGAAAQRRLVREEQPVQAQQQRPLAPPADRRDRRARLELGQRGVQRAPAGRAGGERGRRVLALREERLTSERACALDLID